MIYIHFFNIKQGRKSPEQLGKGAEKFVLTKQTLKSARLVNCGIQGQYCWTLLGIETKLMETFRKIDVIWWP